MSPYLLHIIALTVLGLSLSCATPSGSNSKKSSSKSASKKSAKKSNDFDDGDLDLGGNNSDIVNSATNNAMSFKQVNRSKAAGIAKSIQGKSIRDYAARISALRLGSQGVEAILVDARKVMDQVMKKGINDQTNLDPRIQLEVGIAAIQERNLGLAYLMLDPLFSEKNGRVKAGAYNALAVMNILRNRIPEAVEGLKLSLKFAPSNKAANLNLGLLYLKYGNFEKANVHLGKFIGDDLAKSGLIVSNRMLGNTNRSDGICKQLLEKHPNHKPTLFNCGMLALQDQKNKKKAMNLITKALKLPGGPNEWESVGFKVLEGLN